MDSQRGGEQWRLSPEMEAELRQTLLRLRTEGASNQATAEQLMRSPAVLEIVHEVTKANRLKTHRASTPKDWWLRLRRDAKLREEWRCETVFVLGRRLRANRDDACDLSLNIAGYWRMKVVYAAIKAADNLKREGRSCGRNLKDGGIESFEDKKAADNLADTDVRLDVAMLIDGLENPRQRAVMRLFAISRYKYPEIAAELGISFEQVRYAVEEARKVIERRLRRAE